MRTVTPAPYGVPGLEFGNTSEYPYRPGRPHGGQDHQWRYADVARSRQTYAPVTGVVTAAYNDGGDHNGWGNYVDIDVPTVDGTNVRARLAHHETGTVQVRVGDRVTAGVTRIGTMGDTGDVVGIHLHEELWINGERVDPVYYRTHDIPGTAGSAADDGSRPFKPKEWDEMASRDDIKQALREVLVEQKRDTQTGKYSLVPIADDGNIYLVNNENQKRVRVESPYHVQLIMRRLSNDADDVMLSAENDIVNRYLTTVA